jgi:hypothetical protein
VTVAVQQLEVLVIILSAEAFRNDVVDLPFDPESSNLIWNLVIPNFGTYG